MSETKHYPAWRYHAIKDPVIVADPGEEEALGPGWADTPAAFKAKPVIVNADPEEIEAIVNGFSDQAPVTDEEQKPKRRRGRPRKNPL